MLLFWQGVHTIVQDSTWILVLYLVIWPKFGSMYLLKFWILVSFCDLQRVYESDIYDWELWIVVCFFSLSYEDSSSSWGSSSSHTHSFAFWHGVNVISWFCLNYAFILAGNTCYRSRFCLSRTYIWM